MKIETGVMVVKDGLAWGRTYADGQSTEYGWLHLENAPIHNPEHCRKPEDVLGPMDDHYRPLLQGAVVVPVERHTYVALCPPPSEKPFGVTHDGEYWSFGENPPAPEQAA